jgi:hypothetical protein
MTIFAITNPKLIRKGAVIGSFDLKMPSGLIIRGMILLESNSKQWVNFPSKEYQKQDGTKGYFPLLEFASREISDRFRDKVLPLVLDAFRTIEPAPEPTKLERTRGHWSGKPRCRAALVRNGLPDTSEPARIKVTAL